MAEKPSSSASEQKQYKLPSPLRFKIRTLLIITAIFAVLIGVVVKPYVDARAESRAIERLNEDWELLFLDASAVGRKNTEPATVPWFQKPAYMLFGEERLSRVRKLRIVSPKTESPSLDGLAALDCVTHLEINNWLDDVEFDANFCKCIAQMNGLRDLVIGPDSKTGLKHLCNLPLTRLNCYAWELDQEQFEAIGKIATLESIRVAMNKDVTEKNCAALANLKNLGWLQKYRPPNLGLEGTWRFTA